MGSTSPRIVAVIPARFGAVRFPGKPLIPILGRPLVEWVIRGCQTSQLISDVLVATDDERIARCARESGIEAVMTDPDLPSGSDRVFAAIKDRDVDVVLNIQGDEPLVTGVLVDALARPFVENPERRMVTLGRALKPGDLVSNTTAKIVLNRNSEALYFSRFPIPYSRIDAPQSGGVCLKHIGLYGYRKDFLREFCTNGPVELERAEGLEQLRALYLGERIFVSQVEHESWGVDTPDDVAKVEELLKEAQ